MEIKPISTEVEELLQTPEHRLTSTEYRFRKILVYVYELLEDLQIENKHTHNRLEDLSMQISELLRKIDTGEKNKKTVK